MHCIPGTGVKTQVLAGTGRFTKWVHAGTDQSVRELNSFIGGPEHLFILYLRDSWAIDSWKSYNCFRKCTLQEVL